MHELFNVKWSKYIPKEKKPTPKQIAFMSLPHKEAFLGGAALGGKSEALLFLALQHTDNPDYKGIVFRRSYQDMQLPSAILQRCKQWLRPYLASGEVKYRPSANHTFKFPSGAELAFGYLQNIDDERRYASSEYHYIAFDELTHFYEYQYEFLFSRLRRSATCTIPIRMRSASNPGGVGMRWVRDRFMIKYDEKSRMFLGNNPDAPFIPSFYTDNPYMNTEEYGQTLDKLGKVERERLKYGNWDISEDAIFDKHWFTNRYTTKFTGDHVIYHLPSYEHGLKYWEKDKIYVFTTVDCAASVKTGINGKSFQKDRDPSWSVISTWGITPDYNILWLDIDRFQSSIPYLIERIFTNHHKWNPVFTLIEKNGPGEGVCAACIKKGLPVKPEMTKHDKLMNSTVAQLKAQNGMLWLPKQAHWLEDLEDEIFTWTGHQNDVCDQIDTMSTACNEASNLAGSHEFEMRIRKGVKRTLPYSSGGLFSQQRTYTKGLMTTIEAPRSNLDLMRLQGF